MPEKSETIIEITGSAVAKIQGLIESRERGQLAVRAVIRGAIPGGGYQTEFKFVDLDDLAPADIVQDTGAFQLYFDPDSVSALRGARVDFDEQRYAAGFHIEYPQPRSLVPPELQPGRAWDDPVAAAVQEILDEHVNPGIAMHGGWVVQKDYKDSTTYLQMGGGCQGCGMSQVTLREGIERMIREMVPELENIVDTTDHEEGENPYYAQAAGESPLTA
jgi:Fe/S biogenesis protein NfuA